MAFRTTGKSPVSLDTPESMYKDLRRRTEKMVSLLPPQAQILRDYAEQYADKGDVAFQLPTGSGKTLIGLVMGEWRRRKHKERIVYLCPTKQLVHQVVEQANTKYGLDPYAFVGSRAGYSQQAKSAYLSAEAVAVTTYSAVFNTNPFFDEPQTIILDDVHAAEGYIADLWTVRIRYKDNKQFFESVAGVVSQVLPSTDARKLRNRETRFADRQWVDKIPTPKVSEISPELLSAIDEHVEETGEEYAWSYIRDCLHACHLYVSAREVLIRPLIPPTMVHNPFAGANHRVYMSATLGVGGDLERMTGRRSISRMKPPPDWQKQGIGRRYFFFPERSLQEDDLGRVLSRSLEKSGRSLVLVPSQRDEEAWLEWVDERLGYRTFTAKQIEQSKEPFTANERGVAIVANRYDGIDFPEDTCRFMILWNLPRAVHLQERFIIEKMGAATTLQDRIITRIVQAFGRCTRNDTDYAAILVAGGEIDDYLLKHEKREFFHPEIQAELDFGIDESRDRTVEEFITNLGIFFEHGDAWNEADGDINTRRQSCEQKQFPGREDLEGSVQYEIKYQEALWRKDYPAAFDACRDVLAKLNHSELRGYRALWHYLAGSAAWLAGQDGSADLMEQAHVHFKRASSAGKNLPWLSDLTARVGVDNRPEESGEIQSTALIERMEQYVLSLGIISNNKFNREVDEIRRLLSKKKARNFEQGQERLGQLLGFETGNSEVDAAPDPWWVVDNNLVFVFEDYTDTTADQAVPAKKARQASTHPNWIRAELKLDVGTRIVPVLVTPAQFVTDGARSHLQNVFVWPLAEFREWARDAIEMVQDLRTVLPGPADSEWRSRARSSYREKRVNPTTLLAYLSNRQALNVLDRK